MIVGLAGYATAGKDTAADAFEAAGFYRTSFAAPLKELATHLGWDGVKDEAGRKLLQNLGVGCRGVFGEDFWIEQALKDAPHHTVVTDVRFPNEAEAIKERGGIVACIDRPGLGPVNDHISEQLPHTWDFDYIIKNDSSVEALHNRVNILVAQMYYRSSARISR